VLLKRLVYSKRRLVVRFVVPFVAVVREVRDKAPLRLSVTLHDVSLCQPLVGTLPGSIGRTGRGGRACRLLRLGASAAYADRHNCADIGRIVPI
jgi:hypothetical protein